MKKTKFLIFFALILATSFAIGSYPVAYGEEETIQDTNVYHAIEEDGILTAYSKTSLAEKIGDISVKKTDESLSINYIYAFNVDFAEPIDGKIYIDINIGEQSEKMRVVKVDGKNIQNLVADFSEKISFSIDEEGTYAVINVDSYLKNTFAWYHIILIAGELVSIAFCVIGFMRRVKK